MFRINIFIVLLDMQQLSYYAIVIFAYGPQSTLNKQTSTRYEIVCFKKLVLQDTEFLRRKMIEVHSCYCVSEKGNKIRSKSQGLSESIIN